MCDLEHLPRTSRPSLCRAAYIGLQSAHLPTGGIVCRPSADSTPATAPCPHEWDRRRHRPGRSQSAGLTSSYGARAVSGGRGWEEGLHESPAGPVNSSSVELRVRVGLGCIVTVIPAVRERALSEIERVDELERERGVVLSVVPNLATLRPSPAPLSAWPGPIALEREEIAVRAAPKGLHVARAHLHRLTRTDTPQWWQVERLPRVRLRSTRSASPAGVVAKILTVRALSPQLSPFLPKCFST
eukprot:5494594-Prymnesium_polylepis.1